MRSLIITSGPDQLHVNKVVKSEFSTLNLAQHIRNDKSIVLIEILDLTLDAVEGARHSNPSLLLFLFEDTARIFHALRSFSDQVKRA